MAKSYDKSKLSGEHNLRHSILIRANIQKKDFTTPHVENVQSPKQKNPYVNSPLKITNGSNFNKDLNGMSKLSFSSRPDLMNTSDREKQYSPQ